MIKIILIASVFLLCEVQALEAQKGHGRGKAIHVRKLIKHDKKSKAKKHAFILPRGLQNNSGWA